MTLDWRTLPVEIWLNVFQHVDSSSDLIQCRMVCKGWNPLAEKAIFTRNVSTRGEKKLKGLYEHILKNPRLGKLIKSLEVNDANRTFRIIYLKNLLLLVMHESLEHLKWDIGTRDRLHSTMLEVVENTPGKHKNLKTIPDPARYEYDQAYPRLIYTLRNSLEHIRIDLHANNRPHIWYVHSHLDEFKALKSIAFENFPLQNLTALDGQLQKLQHLHKLKLDLDCTVPDGYVEKDATEMNEWLTENVQQSGILRDFHLQPSYRTEEGIKTNLVEYITYKFSNLERLTLQSISFANNLERLMSRIRIVPTIHLEACIARDPGDYKQLVRMMKGDVDNIITLKYQWALSAPTFTMLKNAANGSSRISVQLESHMHHRIFQSVLSSIGTSGVSSLDVDLLFDKISNACNGPGDLMSFYDMLKRVPQVEHLCFRDSLLKYQHLDPGELVLPNLHSLILSGINIDARALTTISRISPKLHTLRLISCLIHPNGKFAQQTLIQMPSTSFTTLVFNIVDMQHLAPTLASDLGESDGSDEEADDADLVLLYKHYLSIQTLMKVQDLAFLRISCSNFKNQEQCYMLFSKGPPMLITKEELQLYSAERQTFNIECKSITSLSLDIDGFAVSMKFNKDGELENGAKSAMKMLEEQHAILNDKHDTPKKQEAEFQEKLAAYHRKSIRLTEKYLEAEKRCIEAEKRYIKSEKKNLELQKKLLESEARSST